MGRLLTTSYRGGYKTSVMKPALDGSGYLRTVMDGKTVKVHRVVAETWLQNPLNKPQVNHINNDRTDNRIENLEWVTQAENLAHMMTQGRQSRNHGEKSGTHRLTEVQVLQIREFQARHPNVSKLAMSRYLAEKYPEVKPDSIRDVLKGKTWRYLLPASDTRKLPTT